MSFAAILSRIGIHEQRLRRFFDGATSYDGPAVFDHPLYCIGFFNRSGSNLLAEYLRKTPFFSGFHEQLNFDTVENQSVQRHIKTFPDYILEMAARFGQNNTKYGYKASVDQLMMLQRFGIPKMYAGGLRIIHITRQDLIGQAISYQIANQTKKWTSKQDGLGDSVQVRFDAAQVTQLIGQAQASSDGIAMFAEVFGHKRVHVTYEDLVSSPDTVLNRISTFAGQTGAEWTVTEPGIERQASKLNQDFRQLYLEKIRNDIL